MKKKIAKTYIDKKGYPRYKGGNKLVHRQVAQKKVGGFLYPNSVVHHKDGNKKNYRRDNLQVMNRESHSRLHYKERKKQYPKKKKKSWWEL